MGVHTPKTGSRKGKTNVWELSENAKIILNWKILSLLFPPWQSQHARIRFGMVWLRVIRNSSWLVLFFFLRCRSFGVTHCCSPKYMPERHIGPLQWLAAGCWRKIFFNPFLTSPSPNKTALWVTRECEKSINFAPSLQHQNYTIKWKWSSNGSGGKFYEAIIR